MTNPSRPAPERLANRLILSRLLGGLAFQVLTLHGLHELYRETGSPGLVGLLGLALWLPSLLLTFEAGRRADRIRAKGKAYAGLQAMMALGSLTLVFGHTSPAWIYVGSFILSCVRTARAPFFYALVAELRRRGLDSSRVVRRMAISWQLPLVAGPILFSVLATSAPALSPVVIIAGLAFLSLIVSVPLSGVRSEEGSKPEGPATVTTLGLRESIRSFLAKPDLAGPMLADAAVMTFLGFTSLLPFLLTEMRLPATDLGLFRALMNGGSLFAAVAVPKRFFRPESRGIFAATLIGTAILTGTVSGVSSGPVLLVICALIGLLDGVGILYRDALLLKLARPEEMGRFSAINQVLVSTTDDLGEARAGAMAEVTGARATVLGGAAIGLTISAYYAMKYRRTVAEPGVDISMDAGPATAEINPRKG